MFNEYLTKISKEKEIGKLKDLAKTIFDDTKILERQKSTLLKVYKEKLRDLQSAYIKSSDNVLFRSLYYAILKAPIPELGKIIHELVAKNLFNNTEKDILYSVYERRKIAQELANEREETKEGEKETVEAF